ncbi:MAG: hypothetical protein AAFQ37_13285, partial [Bacteroidota bacterium]
MPSPNKVYKIHQTPIDKYDYILMLGKASKKPHPATVFVVPLLHCSRIESSDKTVVGSWVRIPGSSEDVHDLPEDTFVITSLVTIIPKAMVGKMVCTLHPFFGEMVSKA